MSRIGKVALVVVLCALCLSSFAFGAGHGKNGKMLIGYTGFAPTLIFSYNINKGVEDKCKELGYEYVSLMPAETKAELQAIAAVVIGGTSLFGGKGGIFRTVVGVLIIKSLETGLVHVGLGSFWQRITIGIVIILAVMTDTLQRKND